VPGSFELHPGGAHDHPIMTASFIVAAVILIVVLAGLSWPR
jgi:hypothetical protein